MVDRSVASLGVIRHEMRVTRGGCVALPARCGLVMAEAFAQAIARRYMSQQTADVPTEMIVGRLRFAITLHTTYHRAQVYLAPRLNLAVLAWPSRAAAAGEAATGPPAPRIAQPIENLVIHRRVAAQLELVRIEQLVHHLITRAERVEMPAQSGTEQAAQASMARPTLNVPAVATLGASAHGPIAQVVRRSDPQPRGVEPPADLERNPGRSDARPQVMNGTRHPAALEGLYLNRLTDQVIQAIDRRIIAQRERLGRA